MLESYLKSYQLPDTLVADYVTAMKRVVRFGHPDQTKLGLDFRETDAMHIEQCLTLATDLFDACPQLSTFLQDRRRDILSMLLLHELGEPFSGDRPLSFTDPSEIPTRDGQYVLRKKEQRMIKGLDTHLTPEEIKKIDDENFKDFEHACYRFLVSPLIPLIYRKQAKSLYFLFERNKASDLTAAIANLIDRYDGFRTYTTVYLAASVKYPTPFEQFQNNQENFLEFYQTVKNISQLFPDAAIAEEFAAFWLNQIQQDFPPLYQTLLQRQTNDSIIE